MYSVIEVAKITEMNPHTVRYYSDLGLVLNLKIDANGNRLYDEQSVNWLKAVQFLRANMMPLKEIKYYFELCETGETTKSERYQMLEKLLEKNKQELEEMKYRVECLSEKVSNAPSDIANSQSDESNPLNW